MFPVGMGLAGAALATAISPAVSMAVCLLHYLSDKNTIRLVRKIPSLRKLTTACILGVAAYGIVANLALVGTALFNGLSQGLQPLASTIHGKWDLDGEKRIYRHSLQIGIGIAFFLVAIVVLFADSLVAIFNHENSAVLASYAQQGLRLYFLGFLVASVNIVRAGFYSATGKGLLSSAISLSRGVVAIVVFAFVLSKMLGITGVWLAFPAAEIFTLALSQILARTGREKL